MPEKARVFHADQDPLCRARIAQALAAEGHDLVSSASDLKTTLREIRSLRKRAIQVAIIGDLGEVWTQGEIGRVLEQAFRRYAPKTLVFEYSSIHSVFLGFHAQKNQIPETAVAREISHW